MTESFSIPPAPPPPPLPTKSNALYDLLAEEEDEFKEKRYQKSLQFRMVGAIEKENTELLAELIKEGVNTNATVLLVKTPLTLALDSLTLNKGILQLLLGADTETDPDLGEGTPWGLKPLHLIAKHGNVEIAKIFFDSPRGCFANVNVRDNGGATPLHFAIFHGHYDMVLFLLSKGADVLAVDNCGRSTLHRACERQDYKLASLMLERGVDINTKDKNGWTPIFHSVFFRHMRMVRFLIDRGADVGLEDKFGESLINVASYLQWAVERGKHYPVKITIGTSFNFYERSKGIPSESLKELLCSLDDWMYDLMAFFKHFMMLKTLVNTGAEPKTYPFVGLRHTGVLNDALAKVSAFFVLTGSRLDADDPWLTGDSNWQGWFTEQQIQQNSLKRQCRYSIRRFLRPTRDIHAAVECLPLPNSLKMYLQLNEFDVLMNEMARYE